MSVRKLAESKHYIIESEYETVYLYNKEDSSRTVIGDLYGDPEGAVIDKNERFAVIYGEGVIIYRLRPPYQEYLRCTVSPQWIEIGRDDNVMWVESAVIDADKLIIECEDGHREIDLRSI